MSTRLDLVLQKYPEHEDGIRLLASRDPSQKLKYLDWGAKMLASGQALAPEIADILDLFHRFNGQWLEPRPRRASRAERQSMSGEWIRTDIYTYRPQDLAGLRDALLKMQGAQDRRRQSREQLYRIEGAVEADIVYDSADLVVRHIKNKQASIHYGHDTKWCISMKRDDYFEDYEAHNAVFFFFERKAPLGDEFDKVALMVPRNSESETSEAFTTLDHRVDMMKLAKVHGPRIFDIFREIHERSERHPPSTMFQVYAGSATKEQLEAVFAKIVEGALSPHETRWALTAICCNDAASSELLEEVARRASTLWRAAARDRRHRSCWYKETDKALACEVMAAMVIHPNVSADARAGFIKALRRRRISIAMIRRVNERGRIGVTYCAPGSRRRSRRRLLRGLTTVKALRRHAGVLDRRAALMRKRARTLQRKLAEKKRAKARAAQAKAGRKKVRAR